MAALWVALAFVTLVALALLGTLWYAGQKIDQLQDEYMISEDELHAKCIAHIAQFVGDSFAAKVLDAAAEDYESAEGITELRVIGHQQYKPGGPTVPRIWMAQRAARLRGEGS
jgi:hypothetical protein